MSIEEGKTPEISGGKDILLELVPEMSPAEVNTNSLPDFLFRANGGVSTLLSLEGDAAYDSAVAPPLFTLKAADSLLLGSPARDAVLSSDAPAFSFKASDSFLLSKPVSEPTDTTAPPFTFKVSESSLLGKPEPSSSSRPSLSNIPPAYSATSSRPKVDAKLLNGREVSFKRRCRKQIDEGITGMVDERHYGVNINELYSRLELMNLVNEDRPVRAKKPTGSVLWAEKWRPNTFFDLVGNEKTNRYILQWLKQWSRAVFGQPLERSGKLADNEVNPDPFQRPRKKILLIHGPPGIGKTTVAHVLSKQMGYDIMEINASDERSGVRIKDKVHNSLTSMTFSGKPNVLVADEVDGAAENGFIRVLTDLIYHDSRAVANYQREKSRGDRKKQPFLMRPIITICNDLYAPALEKLKPHCEILSFKKPGERLIRERLTEVLRLERKLGLFTKKEVADVVNVNGGDIRSCLNYLQFNSGDKGPSVSQTSTKDTQVNWYAIVNRLFSRNNRPAVEQFGELTRLIENYSGNNYDKIINGCFSLYQLVYYHDEGLRKPAEISDWLYFNDLLGSNAVVSDGFDSLSYSTVVVLKFWDLFSDLNNYNSNFRIPNLDYEHFQAFQHNYTLIGDCLNSSLHHALAFPVSLRVLLQRQSMSLEVLPLVNKIILPEFQKQASSANRSILMANKGNKAKVERAAEILHELNIEIHNKRNIETSTFALEFEPCYDSVVAFTDILEKQLAQKKTVVLPVLAEELLKFTKKRRSPAGAVETDATTKGETKRPKHTNSMDFFKNRYDELNNTLNRDMSEDRKRASAQHRIWVKYHEGFSNAVRKNITWNDLWEN
ncbi:hypothetical protein BABINDRAFT_161349 [Babjeviella inositovora NRRL Y-12698]|uniref:AAA+ ATPase domain-containing protein n=1 Tax=Babjeviella inositovora NRRL Y-12698 TaxID=984486 RepID=A0A1E3QRS8_9ASCO|nr:uncharacterized protein BABINDRAFT_161349 [Babjeviella inositovora NRRL Y-12698]ODQ80403.1 hypothetical protein BABINDRAFT_161349 [Babjeviella inositovora NRRL Y-12698]